jgi:hypothetical protein
MRHWRGGNIVDLLYFRGFHENSARERRQEFAQQLQSVGLVELQFRRFLGAGSARLKNPVDGHRHPWRQGLPAWPLTRDFERVRLYPMFVTCPPGMSIFVVPVSEHNPVFPAHALDRRFRGGWSRVPHDLSRE